MPALNSCVRVIASSVYDPPPLQPQMPKRAGSAQGWALSHLTAACRSESSTSLIIFRMTRSSSFLLWPVALRGSNAATT